MSTKTDRTNIIIIACSIILAGLIIALAVIFSGNNPAPVGTDTVAEAEDELNLDAVNPVTPEDHIKGNANAPVVIVEYSDFDCPFCQRFHDTMNEIVTEYDGEVAWVYRHFPLEQLHPAAPTLAVVSECIADIAGEEAFWTFTDGYYAAQQEETDLETKLNNLYAASGVTEEEVTSCLEGGSNVAAVQEDIQNAIDTGGRGTPWSILIAGDEILPINGAVPIEQVRSLINSQL